MFSVTYDLRCLAGVLPISVASLEHQFVVATEMRRNHDVQSNQRQLSCEPQDDKQAVLAVFVYRLGLCLNDLSEQGRSANHREP